MELAPKHGQVSELSCEQAYVYSARLCPDNARNIRWVRLTAHLPARKLASSAMFVSIVLDRRDKQFTNLDIISGQVVVRNPSPAGITEITVKLEAESASRLWTTGIYPNEKEKPISEVHKVCVCRTQRIAIHLRYTNCDFLEGNS
jgi:hypothetical protein